MTTEWAVKDIDKRAEAGLVGTFHRFGPHGVAYEVIALEDAEHVRIRVVETGETIRYRIAEVRQDPKA
jgi:hypothetical protein